MERKELTFTTTLPADGSTYTRTEKFNVRPSGDPRWTIRVNTVYNFSNTESESSMSYLSSSWEEFEAEWRQTMEKQAAEANKTIIYHQQRDARYEAYKASPVKALIDRAFDDAQIQEWFDEAVQEKDGVVEGIVSFLGGHTRRDVDVRKRLKPLITEAKQAARDEYPEDYREADDKEDFYSDHKEDIIAYLAGSF